MHTVLTRGNAILAYTLSVLACLTFCCFISTVFLDYRTNVKINAVKTLVKNVPNYGNNKELNDLGFITFDLQTDLSGLFNWNVKQLFLYLTAEYKTESNELNQVRVPVDVEFFRGNFLRILRGFFRFLGTFCSSFAWKLSIFLIFLEDLFKVYPKNRKWFLKIFFRLFKKITKLQYFLRTFSKFT